jgi:hypothetical protein
LQKFSSWFDSPSEVKLYMEQYGTTFH